MADEKTPPEIREDNGRLALGKLQAIGGEAAQAATDIGVWMRDRELHHFETEQENDRLKADNDRLYAELLATNNYAILRRGDGWDAEFDLIHWDEEGKVWTMSESGISKGAAITLRDEYNKRRQS